MSKKILIVIALLGVMSSAFAYTIRVLKPTSNGFEFHIYENMKLKYFVYSIDKLNDNEYCFDEGAIIYKVNGKVYKTTLYEVEPDDEVEK